MGCDIHTYVECSKAGAWEWQGEEASPFDWRCYNLFGWLGDVRNYSEAPPIAPRRGLPADMSAALVQEWDEWSGDGHSASWVSVDELLAFDYGATFEDRRVTIGNDGGRTAEPGGGEMTTYREFLGSGFFTDLERLAVLNEQGPTRVVFWFDN